MPARTRLDQPIGREVASGTAKPEKDFLPQLKRLLEDRPTSNATPHQMFSSVDDDFWFWALTAGRRENALLHEMLPDLPAEEMQLTTNGNSGDTALWEGNRIYRGFRKLYESHRGDLSRASAILDFGCGWGRITRSFLRDVEPAHLWGVDASADRIAACRDTSRWGNFRLIDPYPPVEFADATFDLIYSYSVYSHLSEDIHKQWLDEFARILKPEGLLIATTREREFINRCAETGYPFFQETDSWLARYDRGEYCFDTIESYGEAAQRYGEACIPKEYVLRNWTQTLDVLDYINDPSISEQSVVVCSTLGAN